jgi:hypothetical protein
MITTNELEYVIIIILFGSFATLIIDSITKVFNNTSYPLLIGIGGILLLAYIFKLK